MNYPYYYPPQQSPGQQYPAGQTTLSMAAAMPQQNNSGIIWVQGEAAAKAYLVAPGKSVLLMDSENNRFYIKSADASGMPSNRKLCRQSRDFRRCARYNRRADSKHTSDTR